MTVPPTKARVFSLSFGFTATGAQMEQQEDHGPCYCVLQWRDPRVAVRRRLLGTLPPSLPALHSTTKTSISRSTESRLVPAAWSPQFRGVLS